MNKKIFSLLAAGAITTSMLSGVVAHAATPGDKTVDVTYNNQTVIPDPDNPDSADWQVAIPSGINFTDNRREVKTDVELQNGQGGQYSGSAQVSVSVKSKNEYKLKKSNSEIDYKLTYAGQVMENTNHENVGTLTENGAKVEGTAKLGDTNNATEVGQHTDKLTYTVQQTN